MMWCGPRRHLIRCCWHFCKAPTKRRPPSIDGIAPRWSGRPPPTHNTTVMTNLLLSALPHVVIVGAGFGGLRAARTLKHGDVRITVIDRRNYHLFQPLLYQ